MKEISIGGNVRNVAPVLMGEGHFPVIVSNVGISSDNDPREIEIEKIRRAVSAGADVITDLSLVGDIHVLQSHLVENLAVPFSSVAIYEVYTLIKRTNKKLSPDIVIDTFMNEAIRGVDIVTLHATVFREDIYRIKASQRVIRTTSRGGTMMMELLLENAIDNPFYTHFDEILDIAKKYSVCLSLGPCYRPGSVCDCWQDEELHLTELNRMAELVERAEAKKVGIAIEGIGHAPLNRIQSMIKQAKDMCFAVPYRVLTVATDVALGYDHIASAIASAVAVMHGADSITCVTRAEHIGLPSPDETEEAIIAARIAAHCGYIAKTGNMIRDNAMSIARDIHGCRGIISEAIFPEGARQAMLEHMNRSNCKSCRMCGEFCALSLSDQIRRNY
jgi:phosphomethylpyrimidine synthase